MRIIAIEKAVPGVEDGSFTAPLLREEAARAWELYQAGELRELHFRADRPEAVLFLEVQDLPSARSLLARLPLVARGLIDFELVPLAPYPGFGRLFSGG